MAQKGISMEYSEVHKVIGEGNFVLTLSEGALGGEPTAYCDLFRLEDGLIVEHWDVIAPMPGADAPHNEAGKF
jgi:predicted SnoaL-like aldol condensation-catalyzing enzyme